MWNFRFKTQKDNLFGGQTVVENTLRQEGNQLVNEGSKNMKQTNLEVYQNRDQKKFISKNNRQSGRKLINKEKNSQEGQAVCHKDSKQGKHPVLAQIRNKTELLNEMLTISLSIVITDKP